MKYNDNYGYVNNQIDRNTPFAFTHWTFEASKRRQMIVDIQGTINFCGQYSIYFRSR